MLISSKQIKNRNTNHIIILCITLNHFHRRSVQSSCTALDLTNKISCSFKIECKTLWTYCDTIVQTSKHQNEQFYFFVVRKMATCSSTFTYFPSCSPPTWRNSEHNLQNVFLSILKFDKLSISVTLTN